MVASIARRSFLKGLAAAAGLVAAPAVIRVAPLMRVAPVPLWVPHAWALSDKTLTELAAHALTGNELVRRYPGLVEDHVDRARVLHYVRLDHLGLERRRLAAQAAATVERERCYFSDKRSAPHYA